MFDDDSHPSDEIGDVNNGLDFTKKLPQTQKEFVSKLKNQNLGLIFFPCMKECHVINDCFNLKHKAY